MMQSTRKMIETLAQWYSSESTQWELSNEFEHDGVSMFFKKTLCPCDFDESGLLEGLALPMLRLHLSKAQGRYYFGKPSKPCHIGIHWITLTEFHQMSTHMPGFHTLFRVFCTILLQAKLATISIRGNSLRCGLYSLDCRHIRHSCHRCRQVLFPRGLGRVSWCRYHGGTHSRTASPLCRNSGRCPP